MAAPRPARLPPPRPQLDPPTCNFQWRPVFENWSRNWVRKNFWRVRVQLQSEEDALQQCGMVFARCLKLYGDKIDQPKHLMALFKQAVAGEWHKLSVHDSGARSVPAPDEFEFVDYNDGPLLAALARGSDELKDFLHVMSDAPAEFLGMLFNDDNLDAIRRRVKRACGFKGDVIEELKTILS